jgi:hypothetical protein
MSQIELIFQSPAPLESESQVIGNVVDRFFVLLDGADSLIERWYYLQLQQGQARIYIEKLLFALLCDILLEDRRRFGIVSIEAIQDLVNVGRPLFASIKCLWHAGNFGSVVGG